MNSARTASGPPLFFIEARKEAVIQHSSFTRGYTFPGCFNHCIL